MLLLLPLLAACGGGERSACGGGVTRPDKPAPVLEGRSVEDGSDLRLLPGQPTVVNVWGSWCGPCVAEQPLLVRGAQSHPEVRFLGLDVQESGGDAAGQAFRQQFSVPYPSISDFSRELAVRIGAFTTPTTVAIDAKGVIRAKALGIVDVDKLECMIRLAS